MTLNNVCEHFLGSFKIMVHISGTSKYYHLANLLIAFEHTIGMQIVRYDLLCEL